MLADLQQLLWLSTLEVFSALKSLNNNFSGGSPTQSAIMLEKVQNFCDDNHLKLYTFAEDIAASGGYYLLCAGWLFFIGNSF